MDHIEDETGIVNDERATDNAFSFRSGFLLEVLRKAREIDASGPRHTDMPQGIREYHHRWPGPAADRLASALKRYETADAFSEERFDAFFAMAALLH